MILGRMETPMKLSPFELIRNFDQLPNDALVPDRVARLVLNESDKSFRRDYRDNPRLPRIQIGPQRFGRRVGNLRALIRGKSVHP
jgi:hypothetical protein